MDQKESEKTWLTYASSWKAETASERRALYEASLSPDCIYTDPLAVAHGWDELLAYMEAFHAQIPGGHFVTRYFLAHHGQSIAHWDMCDAEGNKLGEGTSHARFDGHGKLTSMTGFFETPSG